MKKRKNNRAGYGVQLLLVVLLVVFASSHESLAVDMLSVPGWLEAEPVADKMIINGLPAKVYSLTAQQSPEAIVDYYRHIWQEAGENISEQQVAYWSILSALRNKKLYTVQVTTDAEGRSSGYLVVSDLKTAEKYKAKPIPSMRGSRVLNDTVSVDPGQRGRTVQLQNSFSVESNVSFYRNHYRGLGWRREVSESNWNSAVLVFRKRQQTVHIVINGKDGTTSIVYQLVTRS